VDFLTIYFQACPSHSRIIRSDASAFAASLESSLRSVIFVTSAFSAAPSWDCALAGPAFATIALDHSSRVMGDAGSRRTDMSQRGATNPNVIARSEHSKPSSVAEQLAMMPPSSSYGRYDQGAQAGSGRQRGGPFYAQLDGLPPMSRDPSNHSNPGFSRSVQRLDMSALGHALPDATGSSATRPYAGYADSASAHGGPRDMQMQHQPIGAPNMQQYGAPDMSQAGMSPGQPFRHQALQYQYPPYATQFVSPMTMDRHSTSYSMLASPTQSTHAGLQQNFMGAMDARPYSSNPGSSLYSPSGYAGVQRGRSTIDYGSYFSA